MTPPAKKTTPAKKSVPSFSDLTGPKDESPEVSYEENQENNTDTSSDDSPEESDSGNLRPNPVKLEDIDSSPADPGEDSGIIEVEDVEEDEDVEDSVEVTDVGILGRIHKMSPPGMTVLKTHMGGTERVAHKEQNVTVEPYHKVKDSTRRNIQDETGKSNLLHPDITNPPIPSEQATVSGRYVEHAYAEPVDPTKR